MFIATFVIVLSMELILRASTVGWVTSQYYLLEFFIIGLISAAVSAFICLVSCMLNGKAARIIYGVLTVILGFFYCAQIVYYSVFGTFFTAYSVVHGGVQVFQFYEVVLTNLWEEKFNVLLVIAICVPLIILVCKKLIIRDMNLSRKTVAVSLVLTIISTVLGSCILLSSETSDAQSPYQKIRNIGEIQGYTESCGLMVASAVDTYRLIFGFSPDLPAAEEVKPVEADDNVIKAIDLKLLCDNEENSDIKDMHAFFAGRTPTKQNEKTGIFKGKNLIFITAEGFSDFAIDEKYTPTLFKLQKEGYSFNNFYNPIWGVSTLDGEYVNLQGLVPKPGVWSMKKSSNNYLPFTLGNSFLREGYVSKAYHNHSVTYYNRDVSHPNLGYEFKGQGREYRFANTWPESDIEMVDKTTEDYLTPGADGTIAPFNVYYLTVSGHLNYNFYGNEMAMKNKHLVEDMDKSDACKAYMATQIEFDRSMELLLERLDEAGVLEDTVIAMAADHYPYGLTNEEISEFRGHDIDTTYEMFKNTFILWTPGMKSESVDKLCCNMDILPTLLNMFGIEFDSRLLMGRDIFSPAEGLVIFKDKNWISEKGTREELLESDSDYAESMDKEVLNMFNYSALVLDNDYYSYLKEYIE